MANRDTTGTSWTLFRDLRAASAVGDESRARQVRELLVERYYPAVSNLVRAILSRWKNSGVDVDDVTQRFFEIKVLDRRLFERASQEKGKFRHLLALSVRHFVLDELGRTRRDNENRRPDGEEHGWDGIADPTPGSEQTLIRDWARTTVAIAIKRLKDACDEKNQRQHFELFARRFLNDAESPSWREVGAVFGLEEKIARSRADTAARHFREILRGLIASDPGHDGSIDDEVRALTRIIHE